MSPISRSLDQWLAYAGKIHPVGIDLGLARVGRVAQRMGFEPPAHRPAARSVIVAGTNGKGSTCMALEALLRSAGLRVGTTLSPHVHVFNERIRLDGEEVGDALLCAAFARVEAARGDIPLTYFEFSALVALACFRDAGVDVAVLEVGLGGRLDAFNLVDADVAVITSIGMDHQSFLGDDREAIGREKAGVLRPGQRVVLGDQVTESVLEAARKLDCRCTRLGVDFHVRRKAGAWAFVAPGHLFPGLPYGSLAPENCALALEAAASLTRLPQACAATLASATLPGRMEYWRVADGDDGRLLILDVAHNPDGARFLHSQVSHRHPERRFVAILGMLADKDSDGVVSAMDERVRAWVCLSTRGPRAVAGQTLAQRVATAADGQRARVVVARDAVHGLHQALTLCEKGDGILAFGSFDLVEQMRDVLMGAHADGGPAIGDDVSGLAVPMDSGR